jgi:putative endopeptidase
MDKNNENSKIVMDIENKLANNSMTLLEQRDPNKIYNKMTIDDLQKLTPNFDWKTYFTAIGLNNPGDINVGQPEFFKGFNKLLKEVPIENWKEYLRWNVINSMADYLSDDFVNQNFDFYGKTFAGKVKNLPRWKRVLETINGNIGEALGQIYVKKYFKPEAKAKILELIEDMRAAFSDRMTNLDWMSEPTKAKAKEKLAAMNVKVGYPDKWRDYSKLDITSDNFVQNVLNANKYNFDYTISKIGKPVDKTEWGMTPQTVNAYYNPNRNEIVFPAAILQYPFFSTESDDAVNYGGIGAVICHEMTHGFDDQGRQYTKDGNLQDWWTPEDAQKFKEKTQVLIAQFNNYTELDSLHINGALTLGENIADLGGLTIAYDGLQRALKKHPAPAKIDGLTPDQRFCLSWAQVWRQNIRDEELRKRLHDDVHSPADARVNCAIPNLDAFYSAFGIKEGDKMYRPKDQRAKIW